MKNVRQESDWWHSVVNMAPNLCGRPANTTHWNNVGLMLSQRRRRWANIEPTVFQRVVFAGLVGQWQYLRRRHLSKVLLLIWCHRSRELSRTRVSHNFIITAPVLRVPYLFHVCWKYLKAVLTLSVPQTEIQSSLFLNSLWCYYYIHETFFC